MANNQVLENTEVMNREFDQLISSLENNTCHYQPREKSIASEWIAKLKSSNSSVDEIRIRNEIAKYLHELASEQTPFPAPFTESPKPGTLVELSKTFPKSLPIPCPTEATRNYLLEMFNNSPDHGQFLANQPVPKNGTFCFLILRKANN